MVFIDDNSLISKSGTKTICQIMAPKFVRNVWYCIYTYKVIQLIEKPNVNWKKVEHLQWIGNLAVIK